VSESNSNRRLGKTVVKAEDEALLLCARIHLSSPDVARLRSRLTQPFDWDYLYKLARRHSLVPLVYFRLEHSVGSLVPPEVLKRFRKDYQENAARNLVLTDELNSVIKECAMAGIETIAFKGPALAKFAYGDLALRRFLDLDLMVRRADVLRAIDVLEVRGYVAAKTLSASQQEVLLRTQHNLQFIRERLIVELHWQVSSELFASSVTAEELWQRLITIELNGKQVRTLATDDLLFSLCVHGSRHLWQGLAWICDIAQIVSRPDINWPSLMRRAKQTHTTRMFLLGLHLARNLFDAPLPGSIIEAIDSDKRISLLALEIIEHLFDSTDYQPAGLAAIFRYNFFVRNDWRSRARYFRYMLAPTESDLAVLKVAGPLRFAYYLLRPFRLLTFARPEPKAARPTNR